MAKSRAWVDTLTGDVIGAELSPYTPEEIDDTLVVWLDVATKLWLDALITNGAYSGALHRHLSAAYEEARKRIETYISRLSDLELLRLYKYQYFFDDKEDILEEHVTDELLKRDLVQGDEEDEDDNA